MYALEGSVKDFYAPDRVQKRTERRLNRQDRRALRQETRQLSYDTDFSPDDESDLLYGQSLKYNKNEDGSYSSEIVYNNGRPGSRPDNAVKSGPEPGVDTTPPLFLPSEDEVEKNLEAATSDLYLKSTIDSNFSNIGTFETTFQESTGHKFHDVDLDLLKNQDGPSILNRDAYTVGQFAAGAPIDTISSDADSIQNEMYWNYFGTTTPPLEQPVRPNMTLPIEEEDELLGNLFPEAIPGEITIK